MRMIHMSKGEAEGFYDVHKARPFFGGLTDFMSSGPCVVMCLEADGAIKKWRDLMGATDPAKADAGTLRKEFGASIDNNATHGSDAPETAAFELGYFFRDGAGAAEVAIRRPVTIAIKDRWIRKALEHGMIEPFEDRQVRAGRGVVWLSSCGYDCRVGDEFKVFTNVYNTVVDPKNFDPQSFVDIKADCCIVPPNSFALALDGRIFPHPARRPDGLPRQVHLRALRHHRQRHAVRAGVGRARHDRDLEHDAAAGEDLRQRGHRAGAVLPERRAVRDLIQGQEGQIPGAARGHAAENLSEIQVRVNAARPFKNIVADVDPRPTSTRARR